MVFNRLVQGRRVRAGVGLLALFLATTVRADEIASPPPVVQKVTANHTKVELTVNASRILKMDKAIPKAQVGNPDLLAFTVLSENEVQIHAKKAGITTVNLWDDKDEIHTVDVIITGDVRELAGLLKSQFPTASIKLYPTQASTLVLYGYVDRPDYVNTIVRIAEDYYPKVINNMVVGGSQQVLLHVKVMEVSRTNLKSLGFDFAAFSGQNFGISTAAGLISVVDLLSPQGAQIFSGAETMKFGLLSNGNGFIGFLEALKRENLLKVLAEPNLVTVSGRPASYLVGGEMPYPQPTGFGNISINFKPFGTQIDFVPIVLGNGGVRLEVRPQVSELDPTLSVSVNGTSVPGFRERMVDTGVEMKFGQTLAIAGLLQQKVENEKRGIPYLMDIPYVGAAFRRNASRVNEVELLITVRPELVEAMDPDQVPQCGPGMSSTNPDECGQYWKGYIEIPIRPQGGPGPLPPVEGGYGPVPEQVAPPSPSTDSPSDATRVPVRSNGPVVNQPRTDAPVASNVRQQAAPQLRQPVAQQQSQALPVSSRRSAQPAVSRSTAVAQAQGGMAPSYNPQNPSARKNAVQPGANSTAPGLIGPIGYDVRN